ncbi:MAG: threonine ammonia-lyase [Dehalococcoidia bacterium]|nr:threonine ammonia-lyase [Dehalococcoidia bacterium]MYD28046.1 threonine ammonia-lyase [Dehalococcoidia bacterium]
MTAVPSVTVDDIEAARDVIAGGILETPVWPARALERLTGVPVVLKCEQLQRAGSFKIRGALNAIHSLAEEDRARGVVAASAGNHAQGVALAAQAAGIAATVVMPEGAPLVKAAATEGYGARVIFHGESLEEARAHAGELARRDGLVYLPPFDNDAVIAGQGTLGLELLEQIPDLAEVLVPAGGGGLLAGVATAIKARRPGVRVVGVQAAAMDGICRSYEVGEVRSVPHAGTLADGVAVAGPSDRTFALIREHVDEMIACGDTAIAHAMVYLLETSKLLVEGAGALGVAALLSDAYRPRAKTAIVLSGGNVDINRLGSIVRYGLVEDGRYRHLTIEIADVPGELAAITGAIAGESANLLEVNHDREAPGLPVEVALIDLLLEVNGPDHFERVREALREKGLGDITLDPPRMNTAGARRRYETG